MKKLSLFKLFLEAELKLDQDLEDWSAGMEDEGDGVTKFSKYTRADTQNPADGAEHLDDSNDVEQGSISGKYRGSPLEDDDDEESSPFNVATDDELENWSAGMEDGDPKNFRKAETDHPRNSWRGTPQLNDENDQRVPNMPGVDFDSKDYENKLGMLRALNGIKSQAQTRQIPLPPTTKAGPAAAMKLPTTKVGRPGAMKVDPTQNTQQHDISSADTINRFPKR